MDYPQGSSHVSIGSQTTQSGDVVVWASDLDITSYSLVSSGTPYCYPLSLGTTYCVTSSLHSSPQGMKGAVQAIDSCVSSGGRAYVAGGGGAGGGYSAADIPSANVR